MKVNVSILALALHAKLAAPVLVQLVLLANRVFHLVVRVAVAVLQVLDHHLAVGHERRRAARLVDKGRVAAAVRQLERDARVVGRREARVSAGAVPGPEGNLRTAHGETNEARRRNVLLQEVVRRDALSRVRRGRAVGVAVLLVSADGSTKVAATVLV